MRYLLFLFSLLLSVSTAFAQTEKTPPVTKLPGEENLSLRERAERDFLMPVRRKKVVVETAKAAEDGTASPESDVMAHAAAPADEVRPVEAAAAPARETRTVRHTSHRSSRSHATRSKRNSSESGSKKASHSTAKKSTKKSSAPKSGKKSASAPKTTKKSSAAPKKKSSKKRR